MPAATVEYAYTDPLPGSERDDPIEGVRACLHGASRRLRSDSFGGLIDASHQLGRDLRGESRVWRFRVDIWTG